MSEPASPASPQSAMSRSTIEARLRAAGCVFAEDEAELLISAATDPARLAGLVARRAAGEPLEQVLGWAQFCGLRIAVTPGVFVPRRRTELLVDQAVRHRHRHRHRLRLGDGPVLAVDLCCGSGAIGAALAARLHAIELYATDLDPAAVRCARVNLTGVGGQVLVGDLFDPLPARLRGRVDVVVANVPYVPTAEIALLPPEAREHEPRLALDGGSDGLDVLRRVARQAPDWLAPGGGLLIEIGLPQQDDAVAAFGASGLAARVVRSDEQNTAIVIGVRP